MCIRDRLSGDRTLCANYIRYLSERIHFLSRKLESLTAPGPAEKLSRCLLESAGSEGRLCCSATVSYTHLQHVDIIVGQQGADGGDDADLVFPQDSDDGFHKRSVPFKIMGSPREGLLQLI